MIRRSKGEAAPVLRIGELRLDPAAHQATFRGNPIELQAREFAMLQELQPSPPMVLQAPPAPVPVGETYRRFTFRPDVLFFAQDDANTVRVPASGYVKSDLKEQIIFRGMTPVLSPPVTMNLYCSVAPNVPFEVCDADLS